ncbi:MAG: NAD+ synthase [Gammaproteobacteria bacterium]|nr:NAD+ synthase [Gammaproteobacteria bacterium]NIR97791.1 NAD+ synthase [Gammaproteobacteria bacterium]NIT63491.1 NAD+ synthase [Gammaproteobacteria bacterium]NIV20438.1 NAD+ synthase [Gammaproteobacteria bacterium]NIX11020.1 NAD+ synthase [Gammaproteobacteria bacterium]
MAQLNFLVGDIEGNTEKVLRNVARARDELGADVVVFPELALTGYPPEDLLLRPGLHMRVLRALEKLRRGVRGIDVIVGLPHQTAEGTYNAAAFVRDGELVAVYHKHHLPNYSVFDEKRYFVPGLEPRVVDVRGVPVALTVCEDAWSPGPVQKAAEAGARMIVNINASPFNLYKGRERETALAQRVEECHLPILYVNLVGGQDELVFDGESLVMDGQKRITQRAPAFEEGLFPAEFDVSGARVRPVSGPGAEPLSVEASAYGALVLGVRDYVDKNGFDGVVVGLSGGIDSALTLAVAVDALGAGRVEAVSMPSRYTAEMSVEDARAEAEALGVELSVIPIETAFNAFLESLKEELAGTEPDTTEENIQARCRGVILMAISNKKRKMVLTTGNKSELAVGYATLYGDMAGGFDVLKDVPKLLVYRLARYRNSRSAVIPRRVLERPPSAELAAGQKDEDSLPPYEVLDPILEMYVEQDRNIEDIVASGFDEATVRKVAWMVDRNEYKRRQAPPGVRITRRAFGRDRRYPITSGFGLMRSG